MAAEIRSLLVTWQQKNKPFEDVPPLKNERMSLENQWLKDAFPTKIVPFFGDMLVFRGVFPIENGNFAASHVRLPECSRKAAIVFGMYLQYSTTN